MNDCLVSLNIRSWNYLIEDVSAQHVNVHYLNVCEVMGCHVTTDEAGRCNESLCLRRVSAVVKVCLRSVPLPALTPRLNPCCYHDECGINSPVMLILECKHQRSPYRSCVISAVSDSVRKYN